MENKKTIQDLFADKKALALFAGIIVIMCFFLYQIFKSDEAPVVETSMSTTIPGANDKSELGQFENKSKLEQQTVEGEGVAMENPGYTKQYEQEGSTYNPNVPGDLNDYMYGQKQRRQEIVEPELEELDPELPAKGKKEQYLEEDQEDREPTEAEKAAIEKQKRLLALLEEYKKDKAKKKTEKQLNEIPTVVEEVNEVGSLSGQGHGNKFYGLYTDEVKKKQNVYDDTLKAIRAMIFRDQKIVNGSRLQMRLIEPMKLRGREIPAGTMLYGVANFSSQRVSVSLTALQFENKIYPLRLTVHDMDGLPGIYVPNIMALEEAKQAAGQTVNSVNIPVVGSSASTVVAASAATAALQGGRQLLNRKVRLQTATLKNNYYVLLKSN